MRKRSTGDNGAGWTDIAIVEYFDASPTPTVIVDVEAVPTDISSAPVPWNVLVYYNKAADQTLIRSLLADPQAFDSVCRGVLISASNANWTSVSFGQYRILTLVGKYSLPTRLSRELDLLPVPNIPPEASKKHVEFIRDTVDWSATALGPQESWDSTLKTFVNMALASPFPVLLSWGKEMTLLYNLPYANVTGKKHPQMMGMAYDEIWSEVWHQIKEYVEKAYQGYSAHTMNCQMFLNLDGTFQQECYFTWSMIPIRDSENKIIGVYIPNFDNTQSVISERRLQTFQSLGQKVSLASSSREFYRRAENGLSTNPIDLPLVAIYSCGDREFETDELTPESLNGNGSRISKDDFVCLEFNLEVLIGCPDDHPAVPKNVKSDLSRKVFPNNVPSFADYIRQVHAGAEMVDIPTEDVKRILPGVTDPTWGDQITHAVAFAIRPLEGERLHAVAIVGLNTRRPHDRDSQVFIELLNRQLSAGIAGVMLFTEETRRIRSLSALDRRKNEELSLLLQARTKELRRSEGKFTRMAEVSLTGIWMAVPNGQVTFVNAAWWALSGHPRQMDAGEFMESVHPEDRERVEKAWKDIMSMPVRMEFRWKRPTDKGLPRWTLTVSNPEYDEEGNIINVFGALSDISERKANEELLRREAVEAVERKRQQEAFIDMTSHEMRNPLSAVIHSVDMVVDGVSRIREEIDAGRYDQQSCSHALQEILNSMRIISHCATHITRIADSTLTFSKLEGDLVVLTPTAFQPRNLVQETMMMFDAEFKAKEIETSLEIFQGFFDCTVDWVEADSSRVSQILINLLTNAIKFTSDRPVRQIAVTLNATKEKPKLENSFVRERETDSERSQTGSLSLDDEDPSKLEAELLLPYKRPPPIRSYSIDTEPEDIIYLVFTVSDTGVGMAESERELLFQRFTQIKPRTHTMYGGNGLGLFISRRLARLLGGEITVYSVEGKGSQFTFFVETCRISPPVQSFKNVKDDETPNGAAISSEVKKVLCSRKRRKSRISTTSNPRNILIVEDNLINQELLRRLLLSAGHKVSIANNGKEAIELMSNSSTFSPLGEGDGRKSLDMCLMDIEMPVMDGITACKKIREMQRDGLLAGHVPIIAVTANARAEQMETMMLAGMDSAVSKPFRLPLLLSEIENTLAKLASSYPSSESSPSTPTPTKTLSSTNSLPAPSDAIMSLPVPPESQIPMVRVEDASEDT
ncbi:hypothetical protein RUND412_010636 [Rhizina undulata]